MSKTIKQIADEIGVSKQAVAYRIKQLEAAKDNGVLAVKENGVLVVSLTAENLIKSAFSDHDRQTFGGKEQPKGHQKETDVLAVLQTTIDTLKEQLTTKDLQIATQARQMDELNTRLSETTAALVTAQQTAQAAQALHAGTIRQQLESGDGDPIAPTAKPGFFTRLAYALGVEKK